MVKAQAQGGWLRRIVVSLALVFGAVGLALEGYTRLPDKVAVPVIDIPLDARELTLVFHGSGGSDEPEMQRIAEAHASGAGQAALAVNWSPASDNRLRAAANAQAVGAELGAALGQLQQVRQLRLIGHSSGAYMLDAVCTAARAATARSQQLSVTSVFLDPFGIEGFADWSHGSREHGRCADFALAIINTDDAAPATNTPLQQAYNVDITNDPQRPLAADANLHYWPVTFYARAAAAGAFDDSASWSHEQLPRGQVVDTLTELWVE